MAPRVNILIVEDDDNIAFTLAQGLLRASHDQFIVQVEHSPLHALELFKNQVFDLLITDQRMPGMSGLELIGHVRAQYPGTRAIVITGFGTPEIEAEASRCADGYMAKPFNVPDVLKLVQSLICDPPAGAAAQAVLIENSLNEIKQRVDDLYVDTGATYTMLLNLDGHLLVDRGNPGAVEQSVLNSVLCNGIVAWSDLVSVFNGQAAFDILHFDGEQYEVYLSKVNDKSLLALLIDLKHSTVPRDTVRLLLRQAVLHICKDTKALEQAGGEEPIRAGKDFARLLDEMLDPPHPAGNAPDFGSSESVPVEPTGPSGDPRGRTNASV